MVVKNITSKQLTEAVSELNTSYDNNIRFNNREVINNKGTRHRFTIRVKDSRGTGSKHGHSRNINGEHRRTNSACWHTHGDLFDILFKINDECEVRSGGKLITSDNGNWEDRNIGSIMEPMYFSEACECTFGL